MLSLSAWLVIAIVVAAFMVLIFTKVRPAVVFFVVMALMAILPVLSFTEAFSGFASESVLLVAILYIIIAGLKYSGALDWIVRHLMGTPKSYVNAILRLMVPVSVLSSVMSNTTTAALFKGVVQRWAKHLHLSPSKLLIPLAYAATMGGLLTLIGTPPNLIISGLYAAKSGVVLNLFAPFPVAICCIVVDITVVILLRRLLPDRTCPQVENDDVLRDENGQAVSSEAPKWKTYLSLGIMVAMLIASSCNIAGFPLTSCVLVAGLLMVITQCCTSSQALKEVDWEIILVFAGSVCMGTAIDKTGLDDKIVELLIAMCGSKPLWILVSVCLISGLLTEIISDTACAAMFAPIMWQVATELNLSPLPFMLVLMMSVSSSFSTPIATPPNLIVYKDGGYRFTDYARIGFPMKICHLATAIGATLLIYPM